LLSLGIKEERWKSCFDWRILKNKKTTKYTK
jgi:hypothetical protein